MCFLCSLLTSDMFLSCLRRACPLPGPHPLSTESLYAASVDARRLYLDQLAEKPQPPEQVGYILSDTHTHRTLVRSTKSL
jgi:hypothetical protein